MRVINASTPAPAVRPSMLLHGLTGEGKSTWATTGGTPLVILTEPKAESVLRSLNRNAVGLVPESLDHIEQLLVILGDPERTKKFDRIVLDSYTELTISVPRWIHARAGRTSITAKLELAEFGHLRDYAMALLRAIQLTGLPSVIIARSVSQRVGLTERIVPDGTGKSVTELPGKLLPTAEARFDPELGYVIDTTPADYSQRCGLPWVPQVWQGSCLDYLQLVERGPEHIDTHPEPTPAPQQVPPPPVTAPAPPAAPAPTPAPAPTTPPPPPKARTRKAEHAATPAPAAPGADDPEWVDLLARYAADSMHLLPDDARTAGVQEWLANYQVDPARAKAGLAEQLDAMRQARLQVPDPEKDPEAYRRAFRTLCEDLQAQRIADAKAAPKEGPAKDFVDGVSPEAATSDQVAELLDLAMVHQVSLDALWKYATSKGQAWPAKDGTKNWHFITKKFATGVIEQLKDAQKRAMFAPWLHQTHN